MRLKIRSLVALAAAGALSLPAAAAQYIVMGKQLDAAAASAGARISKRLDAINALVVEGDAAMAARLAAAPGVSSLMPNIQVRWTPVQTPRMERVVSEAVDPPNNPPGSIDSRFNLQWGHTAVKAVDAWAAGHTGNGARVAVLDGGFSLNHPDIAPQVDPSCSADMTGEGLAYGPNADDPTGIFSHGMHVAGTIAAARNGVGTIGVAPSAKLCLVKVLFNFGSGSFADVAEGIVYAANKGVDIINMSLGGAIYKAGSAADGYTAKDAAGFKNFIGEAVRYAHQRGVTVIVSAGNSGIDGDKDGALIHLPSDAPHAISISATAPVGWATNPAAANLDVPASYTNYGRSVINLAAPGGDSSYPGAENCTVGGLLRACWVFDLVFSTGGVVGPNAFYYWSAGTSMAAPHAAGVAALIVGKYGRMHPSMVRSLLERGATDLGQPGNDPFYGAGRVSAPGSLN